MKGSGAAANRKIRADRQVAGPTTMTHLEAAPQMIYTFDM
jgi:hypothetical protein